MMTTTKDKDKLSNPDNVEQSDSGEVSAEKAPDLSSRFFSRIFSKTADAVDEVRGIRKIVPDEFREGGKISWDVLRGSPLVVTIFCNQDFRKANNEHRGSVGVAGARYDESTLDMTLLDLTMNEESKANTLRDLLIYAKRKDGVSLSTQDVAEIRVSVDLENRILSCNKVNDGPKFFVLTENHLSEVDDNTAVQLRKGDILLGFTQEIFVELIEIAKRREVKDGKSKKYYVDVFDDSDDEQVRNFLKQAESINFIYSLIKESLLYHKHLTSRSVYESIYKLLKSKSSTFFDKSDKVRTGSFVIYQLK